ncbi:uncharacterized protein KY384_001102 [Bacidia gigantensis]|uniref:uncharacterized protein n=1 Tax=Bacidia gigantensis TaxID=2732470 RepID=UPI001D043C0A|nr:uncharacterized protein KY384_001102 [Bacidia gigantensis]KAG8534258.1 hypothetical protein KY384_001102 [Bacidia gigantensis]
MAGVVRPNNQLDQFLTWAKDRGITFNNKVRPAQVDGIGVTMVADSALKADEEIVQVPSGALLRFQSIPYAFRRKHGRISVHGLIASFLAFGGSEVEKYGLWKATWPSKQAMKDCMPILWSEDHWTAEACQLLPPSIKYRKRLGRAISSPDTNAQNLLDHQETKLQKDWEVVKHTDGFILDRNKWDLLFLDHVVGSILTSTDVRSRLANVGYLGEGVCHRTHVAVRIQTLGQDQWEDYVAGRLLETEQQEIEAETFLVKTILKTYFEEAKNAIRILETSKDYGRSAQWELVFKRWKQIKELIVQAFSNGISEKVQAQVFQTFDLLR